MLPSLGYFISIPNTPMPLENQNLFTHESWFLWTKFLTENELTFQFVKKSSRHRRSLTTDTIGKKMTVCQFYAKYIQKRETKKGCKQFINLLSEDKLGLPALKMWSYLTPKNSLCMQKKGISFNTINNHKHSLKAAFFLADDCPRKNLFDFSINEVLNDNTEPKMTLSPEQKRTLGLHTEG